jgi:Holliday junction resolvasome RuvABC endonuclease subunit
MSKTKTPKPEKVSDIEEEVAEKTDEEIQQELAGALEDLFQAQPQESPMRIAELYGVIDEEMASNIVASMLILRNTGKKYHQGRGGRTQRHIRHLNFSSPPPEVQPSTCLPSTTPCVW